MNPLCIYPELISCLFVYPIIDSIASRMSYPWHGETRDHFLPMVNFGVVEQGLYRSGFPLERNRPFLQHLGIRTILYAL